MHACGHVPVLVPLPKHQRAPKVLVLRIAGRWTLADFEAARHHILDGGCRSSDLASGILVVARLQLMTLHVRIDDACAGKMRHELLQRACVLLRERLTIDQFVAEVHSTVLF